MLQAEGLNDKLCKDRDPSLAIRHLGGSIVRLGFDGMLFKMPNSA